MSSKKETELNNAILLYICECQVSGDFQALQSLGIPKDIQEKLRTMTIQEVMHTSRMRSSFVKKIEIDNIILSNVIKRAHNEKKSQFILDKLIEYGAPLKLAKQLIGISSIDFSAMRKSQNIDFKGRVEQASMDEEIAIFKACDELKINAYDLNGITGEQWVALAEHTKLTIRLLYKVIRETEEISRERIN